MKGFGGGKKQRGVALIIALILVALATILATKLSFDGFLELRRTTGVLAAEQALQFGLGAEALAADVLMQDLQTNSQATTLAGPWAQPTQPLPITPDSNPEGEPIGSMQGALEDMQGRFNLNTLARHITVKEEHAAIAEHEIIILWTDYFRLEHAEKYPQLHDLVWKTCKLTSTVKQQVNAQAAQDLLAGVQQIAEIFWETKGVKTQRVPSGQPSGGEIVQPVIG